MVALLAHTARGIGSNPIIAPMEEDETLYVICYVLPYLTICTEGMIPVWGIRAL